MVSLDSKVAGVGVFTAVVLGALAALLFVRWVVAEFLLGYRDSGHATGR